jgi:hypothetical protein
MAEETPIDEERKKELMDLAVKTALGIMEEAKETLLYEYFLGDGPKRACIPPPVDEDMSLPYLLHIAGEHGIEMVPDVDTGTVVRAIEREACERIGSVFEEADARGKEAIEAVKWPGLFGAGNVEVWHPPVAVNYALKIKHGYRIADGMVGIRIPCHRHVNWMRAYAGAFARVLRDHGVEARAWVMVD